MPKNRSNQYTDLDIQLFGVPQVRSANDILLFGASRGVALLAYLFEARRKVSRLELMTLLWPEQEEGLARRNLRALLSRLRQQIPQLLQSDHHYVAVRAGLGTWDVQQFGADLQEEDPDRLARALQHYRGPFLDGLSAETSGEFLIWLEHTRDRYAAMMRDAATRLSDHYQQCEQPNKALEVLQFWVGLEPWNEDVHERLMRLYRDLGRYDLAAQQYRSARQTLEREFGFGTRADLDDLYEAICAERDANRPARFNSSSAADLTPPVVVPHNLPSVNDRFVGRERDLAMLDTFFAPSDLMTSDSAPSDLVTSERRLVSLVGQGGVGKTRLAIESAYRQQGNARFRDGIVFVHIDASEADYLFDTLIRSVARQLGAAVTQPLDAAQLAALIGTQALLLIVDGAESVLDQGARLADVVVACPNLTLLTTTREPLCVHGEIALLLDGLSLPNGPESAPTDTPSDALTLLTVRAQEARATFTPNADDLSTLRQLCRLIGGLPLTIELAASWLGTLSPQGLYNELRYNPGLLAEADSDPNEQQLRQMFEYIWQQLHDDERRVLRRLSVCAESISYGSAVTIAGATPTILRTLIRTALLQFDGQRYQQRPQLARYIREKRDQHPEEARSSFAAHAAHFLAYAQQVSTMRARADELEHLQSEHPDLRLALARSVARGAWAYALQLALLLRRFWLLRGYWREGLIQLRVLFDAMDGADPRAAQPTTPLSDETKPDDTGSNDTGANDDRERYARTLLLQGELATRVGDLDLATRRAYDALAETEGRHTPGVDVSAYELLGRIAHVKQDYRAAWQHYEQALELDRAAGDPFNLAVSFLNLANVARHLHDLDAAQAYAQESLALIREHGDRHSLAEPLGTLGTIAKQQGRYDEARAYFNEVLDLFRELSNPAYEASTYFHLADVAAKQGRYDEARTLLERSIAGHEQLGNRPGSASSHLRLAEVLFESTPTERLLTDTTIVHHASTALSLYRAIGDEPGLRAGYQLLTLLHDRRRDPARARSYALRMLVLCRRYPERVETAEGLELIASLGHLRHPDLAVTLLGVAASLRERVGLEPDDYSQPGLRRKLQKKLGVSSYRALWRRARQLSTSDVWPLAVQILPK